MIIVPAHTYYGMQLCMKIFEGATEPGRRSGYKFGAQNFGFDGKVYLIYR